MTMSKSTIAVIVGMVAVVLLLGYFTYTVIEKRKDAADLTLSEQLQPDGTLPYTDLDGLPVDLAAYEGKLLVINAWATWCPFCVDELPHLNAIAGEYKDENVAVIAINRNESPNTVRAYIETRLGGTDNIIFLLDEADTFYRSIQGFSMPETVFYRSDGSVAYHKRGAMTVEELRSRITEALLDYE